MAVAAAIQRVRSIQTPLDTFNEMVERSPLAALSSEVREKQLVLEGVYHHIETDTPPADAEVMQTHLSQAILKLQMSYQAVETMQLAESDRLYAGACCSWLNACRLMRRAGVRVG